MHLEGVIFLYYGTPTVMPSKRAKKKVDVYSESSLNMPTNVRNITRPLSTALPIYVQAVRLSQFIGTNAYFAKGKTQRGAYQLWRQQSFGSPVLPHSVRLRVADECDLISAGAKYHLACFILSKTQSQQEVKLIWMCHELEYAAEKCKVIDQQNVWERYFVLAEKAEM